MISEVDTMYESVLAVVAAAEQQSYAQLAEALSRLGGASANLSAEQLAPLASALAHLDTHFLGTALVQQQVASTLTTGRACLGRLVQQLNHFDLAIFRFNGTLERTAMSAIISIQATMDRLYQINSSAPGASGVMPVPVATAVSQAAQLLAPLAAMNSSFLEAQCAAVQDALSYPDGGGSALPDHTPTLSYLSSFRAALAALQPPAGSVAAAMGAFIASPTDASYVSLYYAANSTRTLAANARSTAGMPLPSSSTGIVAAIAAANAAARPMQDALLGIQSSVSQAATWVAAYDPGSVAFNRTSLALAQLQIVFDKTQARLLAAGWNASTAAAAAGDSTAGDGAVVPLSATPSAFLLPLGTSLTTLATAVSNGLAAIGEQLDNALGKTLPSPSPSPSPPPSPMAHRRLHQSLDEEVKQKMGASLNITEADHDGDSSFSGSFFWPTSKYKPVAPTGANATTLVRWQLVRRLDIAANTLRGERAARSVKGVYWTGIAVYAAVIAVCIFLGLAAAFNFPAGMLALIVVQLLLAGLVLLLAWVGAAGLVGLHDACGSADTMVLNSVMPSTPLYPLVRYYLQGVGASLSVVLRTAGLGDTARLGTAAQLVHDQLLDPLLLSAPKATLSNATSDGSAWPGSLGTVQYALGGVLVDMGAVATDVSANLTTLLRLGDRSSVMVYYQAVTSWACCGLAGKVFMIWVCATGWLAGCGFSHPAPKEPERHADGELLWLL
ncbi:hypothetical protein GPECTOR_70g490 [Gonium pectorale]|uniref:Uncharacterized protein n=1 Tax=Gonium pectorale TaxID=33097 RepID=A0A150G306_GONPE|nr:hypothetical protein GPECTOR_70g490 [Gonium pectorale]|eukprot:KXZ44259.1 hypothetical protein GPECTOR_70g490 [Gonium pectorale]